MRLVLHHDRWVPQFTQVWEVEFLAEQGEHWVPFCRVGGLCCKKGSESGRVGGKERKRFLP